MGKLKSFGRSLIIGMKLGLAPAGAAQLKVAGIEYTQEAANVCRELAREKRDSPCAEVRRIVERNGEQARKYQRLSRGTARYIPASGDNRCRQWLSGFYLWTADLFESESEEIRETPLIDAPEIPSIPALPKIKLPSLGDVGGIKKSMQFTGVVVMLFIALIIYLMFVRGGAGSNVTVGKVG